MGAGFAAHVQLQVRHVLVEVEQLVVGAVGRRQQVVEVQQLVVGAVGRAHVLVEVQQLVVGAVGRAHVVVEVQQLVVGAVKRERVLRQLVVVVGEMKPRGVSVLELGKTGALLKVQVVPCRH